MAAKEPVLANKHYQMIIKTLASFIVALLLFSCGEATTTDNAPEIAINTPEEVKAEKAAAPDSYDASFADGMTETVFQYYLKLRTALVNSDAKAAKTAATNLAESFGDDRPEIKRKTQAVADASGLEPVRTAFAELTTALEPLLTEGISEGVIYKQHCPMAFGGEGGNWFSDKAEIRNPFYGDKMLKCGKVIKEITAP
jgi:hypothetical protein